MPEKLNILCSAVLLFAPMGVQGAAVSALYLRGYSVIPEPQRVELKGGDFEFGAGWRVEAGGSAGSAPEILKEQLAERYSLSLNGRGGKSVELVIREGSVQAEAVAEQAYRLELSGNGIRITANAAPGLFYGVETLVQLIRPARGSYWLPEGNIVDWPSVPLREVFWDQSERLDHFDVLKQAIRRAAFFKINGFALRLNGHFEYASAPALVDPYAISPAQLQELTDYGLRHYVQVIPYLDGPAHVNFILEHDEYARLREFPQEAFQMCSTNPETYKLLQGMFQDLMDANKGGKYFHLSTDEAWFIGMADNDQCHEAQRAKELGSPSKLWVEYTKKTAGYLQDHGRKVIFWGENPLLAEDIPLLPSGLINGELFSPEYNKAFHARGIPQMIYTNSQPLDPLFPFYYVLAGKDQVHPGAVEERATTVFNEISYTSGRGETDIVGAGVFAWGDHGPHPETFWLGYAVGASAAWHPGSPDPHELTHRFYRSFYGEGAVQMGRLYQLMSTQAQFFATSWERQPSDTLPLIFGYSYGLGPFTPEIATLPLPPMPEPGYLRIKGNWSQDNSMRLELAAKALVENDELENLLYANMQSVEFNRHNLEVYLSIARLCRQNLLMFQSLDQVNKDLEKAQENAAKLHYADAVAALDQVLDRAARMRDDRNQALHDATATWYKTLFPRVREVNGRHLAPTPQPFVDTATSDAARRRQVGLVYLLEREFALPLGEWVEHVLAVRNGYASAHKLAGREMKFDWQDSETLHSKGIDREL